MVSSASLYYTDVIDLELIANLRGDSEQRAGCLTVGLLVMHSQSFLQEAQLSDA